MQGDIYMTLGTNERVYQSDMMNIAPSVDATIYGYQGDWILAGLKILSVSATAIRLSAGKALLQGRLFELKADTTYTIRGTGTQYLGLHGDLTKQNTTSGDGGITNNQFDVGVYSSVYGNLNQGDVEAVIGLYQISINGASVSTKQLVWNYIEEVKLQPENRFSDYSNQPTYAKRVGNQVTLIGAMTVSQDTWFGGGWGTVHLPESMRPTKGAYVYLSQGSQMNRFLITIDSSGLLTFSRYGTTDPNTRVDKGSWLNISTSFGLI